MKKLYFLTAILFLCVFSVVNAKDNDKLIGTWDVTVQDTPQGTVNVHLTIEKEDGKMKAKFKQVGSDQVTNATVNEQENGIMLYFYAEGYDLYMTVRPDGDDAVSGYLVDQFPVKGKRIN
ncbi:MULTISPECIES: hypothetical protein [Cecembia]|uniref:DUF4488 domain-containing protein n=1 Tax=Cecembia lonarensis (strain CCUG 58316 / KCTC 22772 / LW9) TaxID=1225176 RepID=K1KYN1_CECL9|nr:MULTISPECIES: hypothetical protein [Cecembia]EKB49245.1 hypothetical protein B879_02175 [Cecembia lonarensis LW9]